MRREKQAAQASLSSAIPSRVHQVKTCCHSLVVSPDDKFLYAAYEDGKILELDTKPRKGRPGGRWDDSRRQRPLWQSHGQSPRDLLRRPVPLQRLLGHERVQNRDLDDDQRQRVHLAYGRRDFSHVVLGQRVSVQLGGCGRRKGVQGPGPGHEPRGRIQWEAEVVGHMEQVTGSKSQGTSHNDHPASTTPRSATSLASSSATLADMRRRQAATHAAGSAYLPGHSAAAA